MSGLLLTGSLAVSQQPLAAVGSTLDTVVKYEIEALERTKADCPHHAGPPVCVQFTRVTS